MIQAGIRPEEKIPLPSSINSWDSARSGGPALSATYAFVLLFCIVYFFRPSELIEGLASIPFAKIIGALVAGTLLIAIFSERVRLKSEAKMLLLLFGYLCLCIPFSNWRGGSFQLVVQDFSKVVLVTIATMAAVTTKKRLRSLMVVQALGMLMLAALALRQGHQEGRLWGVGGLFADPNDFALNLCMVLPISVAMLLAMQGVLTKLFWTAATGLILFAIVSTSSRGGFLALIAAIIAMWRKFRVRLGPALFILLVSMCLAGVAIFVLGSSSFYDRMATIVNPEADQTGSAQQRKELLIRSITITLRHPIFGVGPGQFTEAAGLWHLTHNSYTQLSSEAGIPALVLFLIMVWSTLKKLRATEKLRSDAELWYLTRGLQCAMQAYLVGAFFLSTVYWFVPYLMMGYAAAAWEISGSANRSDIIPQGARLRGWRNATWLSSYRQSDARSGPEGVRKD